MKPPVTTSSTGANRKASSSYWLLLLVLLGELTAASNAVNLARGTDVVDVLDTNRNQVGAKITGNALDLDNTKAVDLQLDLHAARAGLKPIDFILPPLIGSALFAGSALATNIKEGSHLLLGISILLAITSVVKGISSALNGVQVAQLINNALVNSLRNVEFNFHLGLRALQAVVRNCNLESMQKAAKWGEKHIADFETAEANLKNGADLVVQFRKVRYDALGHFGKLAAKIERALAIIRSPRRLADDLGHYDELWEPSLELPTRSLMRLHLF
eukprot:GHVS01098532.1.p1 GENE.GHVS01098532.1~~GHVS01098532.1.p1  ORF type:complete len:273 (-),score=35.93 GHVS01098532.1:168-986(-)